MKPNLSANNSSTIRITLKGSRIFNSDKFDHELDSDDKLDLSNELESDELERLQSPTLKER